MSKVVISRKRPRTFAYFPVPPVYREIPVKVPFLEPSGLVIVLDVCEAHRICFVGLLSRLPRSQFLLLPVEIKHPNLRINSTPTPRQVRLFLRRSSTFVASRSMLSVITWPHGETDIFRFLRHPAASFR